MFYERSCPLIESSSTIRMGQEQIFISWNQLEVLYVAAFENCFMHSYSSGYDIASVPTNIVNKPLAMFLRIATRAHIKQCI